MTLSTIGVFCGSSLGARPAYRKAARDLAAVLVRRGIGLVYGGGARGLMGEIASTMAGAGAHVAGVTPDLLRAKNQTPFAISEAVVVRTMHERKAEMHRRADAFVALPGGIGTLDETVEAFAWLGLGCSDKPVALLNVEEFYDPLLRLLQAMVREGFLRQNHLDRLVVAAEPDEAVDRLEAWSRNAPRGR
jgi:uncharacterized protein (TIGR00730 family)